MLDSCERLGDFELNQIYTGDARELSHGIPDESVDLIFTDPIYDRIDDYRWLAETAVRMLKPDGAVLVWSNGKWHYKNTRWLEDGGLVYRYDFGVLPTSQLHPMNGKIISGVNRVIWLDKDGQSKLLDYLKDGYWSIGANALSATERSLHRSAVGNKSWGKSPAFTRKAIVSFTHSGALVFDPFAGGGTVPVSCKMLGRNYLAFEIDPDTAERARERVRNTQPPLFVLQPQQAGLWEAGDA